MKIERNIPSQTMQFLTSLRDQFEEAKASPLSLNEKLNVYDNLLKEIEEKFDIKWIRENSYNRSIDYRLDAALKLHQRILQEYKKEAIKTEPPKKRLH